MNAAMVQGAIIHALLMHEKWDAEDRANPRQEPPMQQYQPYDYDRALWVACLKIVYPDRLSSEWPPFPRSAEQGPKKQPASWLFWLLNDNPDLRRQMQL